jgi:hypothetical protein
MPLAVILTEDPAQGGPVGTVASPLNVANIAGAALIGKVGIDQTTQGVTNGVALVAGTALAGKVGIDQTTPGTTNAVALTAGAAIIGKAGIDQTTQGVSNGVVELALAASGVASVTGSFVAIGVSASFTPNAGRPFDVSIYGTFVGSIQLERSFDAGVNWLPITVAAAVRLWTAPMSEQAQENKVAITYRMNCTAYTSGTANYRFDQ